MAPLKGTQRQEPPPKERVDLFSEGCENSREEVGESWGRNLSPSSPVTEISSLQFPYPSPHPDGRQPLAVPAFLCNPNLCFVYVISSGPFSTTFNHCKSYSYVINWTHFVRSIPQMPKKLVNKGQSFANEQSSWISAWNFTLISWIF